MSSNYGLILVILTFVSGVIWLIDSLTVGKKRRKAFESLFINNPSPSEASIEAATHEPFYVDYSKSFFPILLFIVVLRSFLYEPFQIPSASMKPTLTEGDFILVNKYNYGLRLPVTSKKVVEIGLPQRGDIAVFKAPFPPYLDFIKRVVGLPGDMVIYTRNKELYIKPFCAFEIKDEDCPKKELVEKKIVAGDGYWDLDPRTKKGLLHNEYTETLGNNEHNILNNPLLTERDKGYSSDQIFYVPAGQYFVMGDNRDNSHDGRYWQRTSFVPEKNLVGQAVSIWLHLDFGFENKWFGWVPTGVKFERVGKLR